MDVSLRLLVSELPVVAERCPHRSVSLGDLGGRCQVFATDARAGVDRAVTDRPQGTNQCAIDPAGELIWWFDDGPDGYGVWRTQSFQGGPDHEGLPGAPAGRPAGLAMSLDSTVAAGLADDDGVSVYRRRPGRAPELMVRVDGYANLVDIAADGELVAISGEPDGPDAVRLFRADGTLVERFPGTTSRVWALGFRPGSGPAELLCVVETDDGYVPALGTADGGLTRWDFCPFDTEISAGWFPDGRRVLVRQDRHARSHLFEVDPQQQVSRRLPTAAGSILAAAAQADGVLRYIWTADGKPHELRTIPAPSAPGPPPEPARRTVTSQEMWVDGPGGPVHALLSLPDRPAPPGVFLLHGGPHDAARDAYDPMVEVFVSIGCAVVRVNYRGSTGYGSRWRHAFEQGVGLTQLADVAAVRQELVRAEVVDSARTAVAGESWGGYLALLAAGVQPELWHAVAAVSPIADYAMAVRDTTPAVRSLDIQLFGGTPEQVPDKYARSSPITYASAVRAPLLLVAGVDDVKCPPPQIRTYVDAVRRSGRSEPELIWTEHGHEAHEARARVEVISAVVRHVGLALGGRTATAPTGVGPARPGSVRSDRSDLASRGGEVR